MQFAVNLFRKRLLSIQPFISQKSVDIELKFINPVNCRIFEFSKVHWLIGVGGVPLFIMRISYIRVQNMHHKFMRASYMKHFAKFLAILHHNASFFNFCFIINFGFIKNLLHIFEILKYYCCLCLRSLCC